VARTSSFSFKGLNLDVSTIGHKLNVGSILEGSVRRAGNTVRITAQLINTTSGFQLWSQTYDRPMTDILNVQTDVARSVALALQAKLADNSIATFEVGGTRNPTAYDAYLRGNQLLNNLDHPDEGLVAAIAAANQAILLDSNYAAAYVLKGWALTLGLGHAGNAQAAPDIRKQALVAAERAVALGPNFGDAHLVLAAIRAWALFDFAGAAPEYDLALALSPGSAKVQGTSALFDSIIGDFPSAISAARRAMALDPQNVLAYFTLGTVLYRARDYVGAMQEMQHARVLSPDSHEIGFMLAAALLATGQYDQVRQLCESADPMDEDDRHFSLAIAFHFLGRQADAERELSLLRSIYGDGSPYIYSEVFAQWHNTPEALRWLAKAEQLRDMRILELKTDWMLDPVRSEPEFKAILARMNFPP
jgi:tetratricopeptide (TPR) repeat protein